MMSMFPLPPVSRANIAVIHCCPHGMVAGRGVRNNGRPPRARRLNAFGVFS